MAITQYSDINCDGCSSWFDGDPINLIGTNPLYGVTDSVKVVELTYFWLCGDCAPEYPNGAKDFFVADYFEDIPMCDNCGDEEVESKGHFCDYCNELTESLT
jgi:hypothetical protein